MIQCVIIVTYSGLQTSGRGDELLDLCDGLFEGGLGDVGQQDIGALFGEENGRLKANAAV